ncbi:histidine kinase [Streptomyces sp. NPDC020965]|uniref:histidine kinase n=1 Tax=Streptomyces sp. NPDC020965 TaxID=3365105 RepID=UPI0037A647B8
MAVELVLALVMALVAAGIEQLAGVQGLLLLAVAAGAALLSLLRRRLPVPALIATAGLSALLAGFVPLLMLVGWSAGRRILGVGRALTAFGVAYVLFAVLSLLSTWSMFSWSKQAVLLALLITLSFLATAVVPGLVSRYWSQRRTLLHALQERNTQLLWERQMVAGQARLLERQRIAQDMHDSLGHQLALISVHTGALEVDPELTARQREGVGVLRNASVTAMHELREVVGILRDGVEAPAGQVDEAGRAVRGAAGIEELVASARAAGNTVALRRAGDPRPLAAAADHAAYRIAQEALTNAYKHAPGASIEVELRYEPDSFVVEIVSGPASGGAGDAVSGGRGLTGLRERARLVGGMVHAGPVDGGGFRVAGVLPYGGGDAARFVPVGDAARFVPVDDAFPHRTATGGPGDGAAPMDWSVVRAREPLMGELDVNGRRGRVSGFGLGCGVAVAAGLILLVAVAVGVFFLWGSMEKSMIDPAEYEKARIGAAEKEIRDRLPSGDTFATSGLGDKGPKEPAGSDCLVLMSSEFGDGVTAEPVFRFCFKDGRLIEKKAYDANR